MRQQESQTSVPSQDRTDLDLKDLEEAQAPASHVREPREGRDY
jgi:hypothetical protein